MHVCFVGDSFVNGTGDPECLGWAGRVCTAAHRAGQDITYYNLGVRAETSLEICDRWLREVTCRLPQEVDGRIVFSFGVNDTTLVNGKTRVALSDSLESTRQILSSAQRLYPTLMVGPPPTADAEKVSRIARLSQEFALLSREFNVPYLDVLVPLRASEVWMSEVAADDGAHPRSAGYSELARLMQRWPAWLSWFK